MSTCRYWFPARRYGWGWGLPCTWQGWLVIATYFVLLIGGVPLISPEVNALPFLLYVGVITAVLLLVCFAKGEPPRWRWGGNDGA